MLPTIAGSVMLVASAFMLAYTVYKEADPEEMAWIWIMSLPPIVLGTLLVYPTTAP